MSEALRTIAGLVHRRTGIILRDERFHSLRAALRRAAPELDAEAFRRLAEDPVHGARALDRLIEEVTVKETSFFRDRRQLEGVMWRTLHEAAGLAGSGTVRVWVAACATGEEAYTLAILACEAFAPAEPPVRILATDLSADALARANEGVYRPRAMRAVDPALRDRYFHVDGDAFVVGERLRRFVTFRRHNLAADPAPPFGEAPFELISCRNVLIYFDGDVVGGVIDRLEGALSPHGDLLLGSADALCVTARRLARLEEVRRVAPRQAAPTAARPPREPGRFADVLTAANEGRADEAMREVAKLLAENPLDADAYFARALLELGDGRTESAISSLRRALYADPSFGLAAFKLGRAFDAVGDSESAALAYEQALRTLADDDRNAALLGQIDLGDVAAACRARIGALS